MGSPGQAWRRGHVRDYLPGQRDGHAPAPAAPVLEARPLGLRRRGARGPGLASWGAKGAFDQSLILSGSLYNAGVILACAVVLGCAYFSIRSYRELPSIGPRRTILGAAGIVVAAAAIAAVPWSNRDCVRSAMWRLTLNRIDDRLQKLETLDEQIQFLVNEGNLASAAVGIVVNESLVWAEAYGETDI